MKIPIFYRPEQSISLEEYKEHPSLGKPELVMKDWVITFKNDIEIVNFDPISEDDVKLAHLPSWVDLILTGKARNGFGTFSNMISESLLYTSGSFYAAAQYALKYKTVAVSPTSGFHHAEFSSAGGFCTFNGLMISAIKMMNSGCKSISIIDLDAHYGNGIDSIIKNLNLSMVDHFSFGGMKYPNKCGNKFFSDLQNHLNILKENKPDIIFFQAGADPHVLDPLGGFLTTEEMIIRDQMIFKFCNQNNIPLIWNLAGGYQNPISLVVDLHRITMRECIKCFGTK